MPEIESFDDWWQRLLAAARKRGYSDEALADFHQEDWKEYYDDGDSPEDAIADDESHA